MSTKQKTIKHTDRSTLSINMYFNELKTNSKYNSLTAAEELYLFMQYNVSKDSAIKEKIINSNMKWVITQAKSYLSNDYNIKNKITFEDLISEGNIGLLTAFDNYDVNKNVRFLTFAQFYIKREIFNYINNIIKDIPQPANRCVIDRNIKKSIINLKSTDNYEPSIEQIIEEYSRIKKPADPILDMNLYFQIKNNNQSFISSSQKLKDSEDMHIEDIFKADKSFSTDYNIDTDVIKQRTLNSLKKILKDNEYYVIINYFGLEDGEEKTIEYISSKSDYTSARIGQLLKTALIKLKEHKVKLINIIA